MQGGLCLPPTRPPLRPPLTQASWECPCPGRNGEGGSRARQRVRLGVLRHALRVPDVVCEESKMTALRNFLHLYDARSRRALRIAVALAVGVSIADFVALSVLYPVFGSILGGGGQSMPVSIPLGPTALVVVAVVMLALRSVGAFWVRVPGGACGPRGQRWN